MPTHKVVPADYDAPWQSSVAKSLHSKYHRIVVERSSHALNATAILLDSLEIDPDNRVLIIDADLSTREHKWRDLLRQLGIRAKKSEQTINQEPLIQELIHHLQLASGLEAWSFERLRRLANSSSISLNFDLDHPTNSEIIPRPHTCLLYTSPSPRDATLSRMPSSA